MWQAVLGVLVFLLVSCKTMQPASSNLSSQADVGELRGYGEYNRGVKDIFFSESDPARDHFDFARFTDSPLVIRDLIGFSVLEDDRPNYAPSAAAMVALNYAFHSFIDHLERDCTPGSHTLSRCTLPTYGRSVVADFYAGNPSQAYLKTVSPFNPDSAAYDVWLNKHGNQIKSASDQATKNANVRMMMMSVFLHPYFLLRSY